MFSIHRIRGDSMSPSLCDGDFVISLNWLIRHVKVGDIVIVRHPHYGVIVKRIKEIDSAGKFTLSGDSPASTSTEKIGTMSQSDIVGRVVFHAQGPNPSTRT